MKGWLAAREVDVGDVGYSASFANHSSQQVDGKKLSMWSVEIFISTKTITAMKIADVCQLHAQTPWSIIAAERGLCLHQLKL
jgi:hypothetical protein